MSFEFTESVTLTVPDISDQMKFFNESVYRENNKLITEIAAIHAGLTSNFNMYSAEALEASLPTWIQPYAKPVILNHDEYSDSIGRIMASSMSTEDDGTRFVLLQAAIMDPLAITKIRDQRYLTGSVGGSAKSAKCSICDVDWAKEDSVKPGQQLPCKHRRGKVYEGKLAFFDLNELSFREYSFVNMPADQQSGVRKAYQNEEESEEKWSNIIKMFSLDMNKQSITEITESHNANNVLDKLKKKEAQFTYLNTKGTFLAVSALDYQENDGDFSEIQENSNTIVNELDPEKDIKALSRNDDKSFEENKDMSRKETIEGSIDEQDEDILSITDQLSQDLATTANEGSETDDKSSDEEDAPEELSDNSDEKTEPDASEEKEEEKEVATDAEEKEEKEEQLSESPEDGSPEAQEDEGKDEGEVDPTREQAKEPEDASDEDKEEAPEEGAPAEGNESEDADTALVAKLQDENAKLRTALRQMLAERVVDAKIAAGIENAEDRTELVEEHTKRTVSSLADAIRDLGKLPKRTVSDDTTPTLEPKSVSTDQHEGVEGGDAEAAEKIEPEATWQQVAEDAIVNRLLLRTL